MRRKGTVAISLMMLLSGLIWPANATGTETEVIALVRSALASAVNSLPSRRSGTYAHMREFGFRNRTSLEYRNLAVVASNNYEIIFSNFGACATNDLERMVLMSAGWAYDDDYYLRWYSDLIDLAVTGVVSRDDVKWYNEGSGNEMRMNLLALRYDAPGISNIVCKLQGVLGKTNYCQKILTGESRRLYLRYKAEIECENQGL